MASDSAILSESSPRASAQVGAVADYCWTLEIVLRPDDVQGFQVLSRRWVVERTFGWLGRYRRLSCDFEHTVSSSEVMTYIASIRRMLKLATK